MNLRNRTQAITGIVVAILASTVSTALAQPAAGAPDSRWSAEFGIGLDNSISGNINSSAIGTLNNQTVVILKNQYEDVYGTGLHLRFGGGYMLNSNTEARATFTFQSLDADLVPMGDIGVSRLYAQYTDYQSLGLDVGIRRYGYIAPKVRGYGEGTLGIGFVDKTDVTLVAPSANLEQKATDFYDQTAAFTLAANVGVLVQTGERIGFFGQIGLRWVSGMAEIDNLEGTSLDTINDSSARWTMPFIGGIRFQF
jgi:opacity protein-like surface antigen